MMNQLRKLLAQMMRPLAPYRERMADALSPAIGQMQSRYQKLESREKTLVKIAGGVVTLFIAYTLIYSPIASWRDSLDTTLDTRHHEIGEVQHLVDTYLQRKKQL
ncbi:MAG TPA: type II secretion system protein GspM, partial [Candidatus Binataceae bacterium]|nr:type II secretion system protein GspM [Candidatus Binataceae bacterium]